MVSGVYEIVNQINGKRYIGSGKNTRTRISAHLYKLRRGVHPNAHMQASYNKHGNIFCGRVILRCQPENLLMYEQLAIDGFAVCNPSIGYNKRRIAESNTGMCEISRKVISIKVGKLWENPEYRARMSAAHIGHNFNDGMAAARRANVGRKRPPMSDEQRAKISAALTGRKLSASRIEQMRMSATGRKPNDETRAKLRIARAKQAPPMLGKIFSEDHKRKISESNKTTWARKNNAAHY